MLYEDTKAKPSRLVTFFQDLAVVAFLLGVLAIVVGAVGAGGVLALSFWLGGNAANTAASFGGLFVVGVGLCAFAAVVSWMFER